jgi:hypothetical protein
MDYYVIYSAACTLESPVITAANVGSQYKICQSRTSVCCKNRARVFFHCMWFSVSNFFSTVATAPRA